MPTTSTGRDLALVAGILAAGGALAILLQDAIRTNVWQLEHGLIPALMAVQILTAHLVIAAFRQWRIASGLGFLIVAIVATWGVLYTSVGKQSSVAAENTAQVEDTNGRREALKTELAKNQAMLFEARAKLGSECETGEGSRCRGKRATVKVYEDAVAGVEAKIEKAGPLRPVAANADKMAELLAMATSGSQAKIKHFLLLVQPFTYATIFELASLVSFGFAFSGRRDGTRMSLQKQRLPPIGTEPSLKAPEPTVTRTNRPFVRTVPRTAKDRALADLLTKLALGERFGSQDEIREQYGVAKSTVSEWLAEWEQFGIIPNRQKNGRCKALSS